MYRTCEQHTLLIICLIIVRNRKSLDELVVVHSGHTNVTLSVLLYYSLTQVDQ